MAEVFINIDFNNDYQISNFGNVKHVETNRIILRQPDDLTVKIGNWGGLVRTLVAVAFVENLHGGYIVESIDENAYNVNATNLRWKPIKNCVTRSPNKNNTSGVPGVSFEAKINKWRAQITVNKIKVFLGYFINKEDAIRARQEAEVLYFQEFRAV